VRRRALVPLLLAATVLGAQRAPSWKDTYIKREVRIPMRDGVELFTAIYTPRSAPGPLPFLLNRTCYGIRPYGHAYPESLGPSPELARDGFIFVYQDVRGRMMSGGDFLEMTPHRDGLGVDEATDTYDTIQWLLDHVPGHNGRVGAWGISYPGFYAASALVGAHPALKAVSPQAPIADVFAGDDDHHNGALFLSQAFWFNAAFGQPRPEPTPVWTWALPFRPAHDDGYRFFLEMGALSHAQERFLHGRVQSWNDLMAHDRADAYWQQRDLRPHLRNIRPAVLTVGGWFDAEDLFGSLQVHRRIQETSPGADNLLVMGPWSHGGWSEGEGRRLGDLDFGQATGAFFRREIEAPFFLHFLKDAPDPRLPKAFVFQTGSNLWRRFDAWPPRAAQPTRVFLAAGGGLTFQAPRNADAAETFLSDPHHPVPYTSRTELNVSSSTLTEDQRFAARRPDVLVYQTPALDRDLTLAGPIQVHLRVSTTGTDADWVVKVIDVYPDAFGSDAQPAGADPWHPAANVLGGYQQLVRGDVMRGKFRHSLTAPEPFVPGQPTLVPFTLNDVCHTFRAGHRLMVQVQSSWFPLVDRNPQVFLTIPQARDEDFQTAEHRVFQDSSLELPVLK
jgi:putative CocE/NonD family hydrolase